MIDNMEEAPLQPDERTDLVFTNMVGHGWTYKKRANQQAEFGYQPRRYSRFVETKTVR